MVQNFLSLIEKSEAIIEERRRQEPRLRFRQVVDRAIRELKTGESSRVCNKLLQILKTDAPTSQAGVEKWVADLVQGNALSQKDALEAVEILCRPWDKDIPLEPTLLSDFAFFNACDDAARQYSDVSRRTRIERLRKLHQVLPLPKGAMVDSWLTAHCDAGRLTRDEVRSHLDLAAGIADNAHYYLTEYETMGREVGRERQEQRIAERESLQGERFGASRR